LPNLSFVELPRVGETVMLKSSDLAAPRPYRVDEVRHVPEGLADDSGLASIVLFVEPKAVD
jgi:hypothetical protein